MSLTSEFHALAAQLQDRIAWWNAAGFPDMLERVRDAANEAGRCWSGSCIGYHANVYFKNIERPPPGAHFDPDWGIGRPSMSAPGWKEHAPDAVRNWILQRAQVASLDEVQTATIENVTIAEDARRELQSLYAVSLAEYPDDRFLKESREHLDEVQYTTAQSFVNSRKPKRAASRDHVAINNGIWTPPHIGALAEATASTSTLQVLRELAKSATHAANHLHRLSSLAGSTVDRATGSRVFIGHGRSALWKDVKDFVQDRLGLPWDEFNRVPVAGIANAARLQQMLGDAVIAIIVLTAEDETPEGRLQARQNVIHEAGLFQGHLGFERAILLLEDGCDEFSNINGLGQIRFPKGDVSAAFEDIRRVFEREGLI
ncbi:nucleotide-binding protein [Myxococcota bacterium]|nr:nucleotide-binding protein [Myxococcota bacterium]